MPKVIIIGAGPAGLLLAHYLLEKGSHSLEIYERRSDPRSQSDLTQRSFPVVLQSRGLSGLQGIDGLMTRIEAEGIWSEGSILHSKRGKSRQIKRKTKALIINRTRLTQVLLDELTARYGNDSRLSLHFDCNLLDVNLPAQTISLNGKSNGKFIASFDQLVGADGALSQVRESLSAQNYLTAQSEQVSDVYKSLSISRISNQSTLSDRSVHAWSMEKGIRLVMAPQPGDRLSGTLIFPPERNPIAHCHTAEDVLSYMETAAPSLQPFMTLEDAENLREAPIASLTTVKCDRLSIDNTVVLIGDAAHAVSPSIGQGCNSALQDVLILSQTLDDCKQDWTVALPRFTEKRLPDVHALRELSDYTFPRSRRMAPEFIFRMTIGKKVQSYFPKILSPLPMELVMDTDQSYSSILTQCQGWINRVRTTAQRKRDRQM
ncbi:MAG: NAD(P)/FAD-dependent oxidoreductase [Cyanobacteria bacterium P01_F01_bin.3]